MNQTVDGFSKRLLLDQLMEMLVHKVHHPLNDQDFIQNSFGLGGTGDSTISKALHGKISRIRGFQFEVHVSCFWSSSQRR